MNRVRSSQLFAFAIVVGASSSGNAQDFPDSLVDFLKPGTAVQIQSNQANPTVHLIIFTELQLNILKDSATLTLDELRRKYPLVDERAEEGIKAYESYLKMREANLPPREKSAEPTFELSWAGGAAATVVHVGSDYVLVKFESAAKQAISKYHIARLSWGRLRVRASAKPAAFNVEVRPKK